jgi:hypothetical protein
MAQRLQETRADRSFTTFISYAADLMPDGALARAEQAGLLGFVPNNNA